MSIEGDSGEYEFLTEAVKMTKYVRGMCVEVGLRKGLGTKTIIDACLEHRPGSTVISIDPFGSIEYVGREHIGKIRLDYTNDMYKEVLADMSAYVIGKDVNWLMFKMTDTRFFREHADGVELYDLNPYMVNKYAMVHFDGEHYFSAIEAEFNFFNDRMDSGATIVIDDCTPDFIDIAPVNELFKISGWALYKEGIKKNIYQKQ